MDRSECFVAEELVRWLAQPGDRYRGKPVAGPPGLAVLFITSGRLPAFFAGDRTAFASSATADTFGFGDAEWERA